MKAFRLLSGCMIGALMFFGTGAALQLPMQIGSPAYAQQKTLPATRLSSRSASASMLQFR